VLLDEGNGGEQTGVEGLEGGFAVESLLEGAGKGVVPEADDALVIEKGQWGLFGKGCVACAKDVDPGAVAACGLHVGGPDVQLAAGIKIEYGRPLVWGGADANPGFGAAEVNVEVEAGVAVVAQGGGAVEGMSAVLGGDGTGLVGHRLNVVHGGW